MVRVVEGVHGFESVEYAQSGVESERRGVVEE